MKGTIPVFSLHVYPYVLTTGQRINTVNTTVGGRLWFDVKCSPQAYVFDHLGPRIGDVWIFCVAVDPVGCRA